MIEFIFAKQNLPFMVSIVLMVGITMIEGLGTFLGHGVSEFLDTLVPDIDLDVDIDAPDFEAPSGFTKLLGWLRIGQVPALVLLIVFLTSFGLFGLVVQTLADNITGDLIPASLAAIPAFMLTIPAVRVVGGFLALIIPKDETDAVSEKSFIGRTASIVLGKASQGKPAQAKLTDHYGTTHYLMVEPDLKEDVFEAGTSVLLVSQSGSVFKAILNTNPALTD